MDRRTPTPEEIERAKSMSIDEIFKAAADEGIDLSEEEMDQIAGGFWFEKESDKPCPKGGSHIWKNIGVDTYVPGRGGFETEVCTKCGLKRRAKS